VEAFWENGWLLATIEKQWSEPDGDLVFKVHEPRKLNEAWFVRNAQIRLLPNADAIEQRRSSSDGNGGKGGSAVFSLEAPHPEALREYWHKVRVVVVAAAVVVGILAQGEPRRTENSLLHIMTSHVRPPPVST
jgi:hypothetical protein